MSKSFSIRLSTEETMALVVVLVDRLADVKSDKLGEILADVQVGVVSPNAGFHAKSGCG